MITTLDGKSIKTGEIAWEIGIGEGKVYKPTPGYYKGSGNKNRLINPDRSWSTKAACQKECDRLNTRSRNKHIVIIGHSRTRTYQEAQEIADNYDNHQVARVEYYDRWLEDKTFFSECSPETELLIFETVTNAEFIKKNHIALNNGIKVHRQGIQPFTIYPRLVFVCSGHLRDNDLPTSSQPFIDYYQTHIMC